MGVVQLSDDVMRVLRRQVAEGRATSEAAFVEEAVLRLVEEDPPLEVTPELLAVIEEGRAEAAAGRVFTVASKEDEDRFWADIRAEVDASVADEPLVRV